MWHEEKSKAQYITNKEEREKNNRTKWQLHIYKYTDKLVYMYTHEHGF